MDYTPRSDDGSMPPDFAFARMLQLVGRGLAAMSINLGGVRDIRNQLERAGFTSIHERTFKVPLGPWARDALLKKVGAYYRAIAVDGLQAITLRPMCNGLGWTPEEVDVFLGGVRRSLLDAEVHAYQVLHVIYAQKAEL